MRKVAASVLAVPVLAALYLPVIVRRTVATRLGLAITGTTIVVLVALTATNPVRTAATPPGRDMALPAAAFRTEVRTGLAANAPIELAFTLPMDATSVASALDVDPPVAVRLAWNEAGTVAVVTPVEAWRSATLHTITVPAGTLDANGTPTLGPARATFMTRTATSGRIDVAERAGRRAALDTAIVVTFDRPVDLAAAAAAFSIRPAVEGAFELGTRRSTGTRLAFRPAAPLPPDTAYLIEVAGGLRDEDGAPVGAIEPLEIRTAKAPAVVRFRPLDGARGADRTKDVSVRFTQPMDRRATAAAFSVSVGGKPVAGRIRWAEGSTVLVFDPEKDFGYAQKVDVSVAATARSAAGALLASPITASFTTEPKPVVRRSAPTTSPVSPGGGTSAGSATWYAVEVYYMRLMNCTRTGGWVTSTGGCSSPGGRDVAALRLDAGISSRVARPYAKLLATRALCSHFIGGNPGDRLRRAGYTSYRWAENLGCRSGNPYSAVLGSHLFFQSEKPYNGGHYRNLMNAAYDRAGIGVWVSGGRVRLVVDFYHP